MNTTRCKYCNAVIAFVWSIHGHRMPVDPEPDPKGNLVLERATTSEGPLNLRRSVVVKPGERPDELRYMPHQATCTARPAARRARGGRGRGRIPRSAQGPER